VEAWVVDDTAFPKKGTHSVGVAHQYCGNLGKQANGQDAVSLSLVNHHAGLPVAYRLYLPEEWTDDPERCRAAGVPKEVVFQKPWELALALVDQQLRAGVPMAPLLADAGYGYLPAFRKGLMVKDFALSLPQEAWQEQVWREGTKGDLHSRFAWCRVSPSAGCCDPNTGIVRRVPKEEWLLMEWPEGEEEPGRYWLSTMPEAITMTELIDTVRVLIARKLVVWLCWCPWCGRRGSGLSLRIATRSPPATMTAV
jgi:SRSO17 transposase